MTKKIKTIIVDDEPLAGKRLTTLLRAKDEVELVAVCANGMEAIEAINTKQPDLVFLDIQMPEITGFDVLQNLEDHIPAIIFVTAYDQYAIKAFEVHAVDYLLKPFDKKRFDDALAQAKKSLATPRDEAEVLQQKVGDLLESINKDRGPVSRVLVKSSGKYQFVKVQDIEWIESAGNYVRIHTADKGYLIRDTMTNMEQKLQPDLFFRIHRSAIINVDKVKELEQWFHGDYKVTLKNGEKLTMSRNYKDILQHFM